MEARERRNRESSTMMMVSENRGSTKVRVMKPTFKKVQVVYYLSKNGNLEHPHFIEVTHFANHPLRLKDVLDRLTVLRGKGMPSLYSWSCKRSYKNGYVWNDLAENDAIYPSEGAEFVLKGCKLIEASTEILQQIKIGNSHEVHDPIMFNPKRKMLAAKLHLEPEQEVYTNEYEAEDEEYEEKMSYNTLVVEAISSTSNSRRHSGVSKEKSEPPQSETTPSNINPRTQLVIDNSSPPSTASSTNSEKANEINNSSSNRFEDGNPIGSWPSRGSLIRQLIACGGGGSVKPAAAVVVRAQPLSTAAAAARKSSSLHKGVLCKTAAAAAEEEDVEMIKLMSENPRFGNVQAEEKEYFSGSIVEGMNEERMEPENGHGLQKSSSYNEERSSKAEFGEVKKEERQEEEMKREKGLKGKCLPIKMTSTKQSKK